jgi:hypothetical protein
MELMGWNQCWPVTWCHDPGASGGLGTWCGVWELDVPLVVQSTLLDGSFIFLDVRLSILFLVFAFFFFVVLVFWLWCFGYFMIVRVSSYHGFMCFLDTNLLCVGISLKFQNLTVCSCLVLSSKSVATTTSWKWCLRRRPIHIKTAQYLGPTELMGEKLLGGGIHGNVHWI